jgi:ubiquinone/menaquinone biosynthesis C-methylase UbiE
MRALEYGAGTGLLSFLLRDRLGEITLADVSEGMLDFDVVYSLMTLHHIGDTDAILRAFHRVLAHPGLLCIADLDAEDGSFHGEGFDGHRGFDRDALAAKARAAGFVDARFVTAHVMQKQIADGTIRAFPVFLMIALKG